MDNNNYRLVNYNRYRSIPADAAAGSNCADCNRSASSVDVFGRQVIVAAYWLSETRIRDGINENCFVHSADTGGDPSDIHRVARVYDGRCGR